MSLLKISQRGWRLVQAGSRAVLRVANFYGSQRELFWRYLKEDVLALRDSDELVREIRVRARDRIQAVERRGVNWHVRLPDCCVVCGTPTESAWQEEQFHFPDIRRPLRIVVAASGLGLGLSIYFWSVWPLPAGLLVGLVAGYALRREIEIHLRLRRCDEHAAKRRFPKVWVFGNTLIIRVGDATVRQEFLSTSGLYVRARSQSADEPRSAFRKPTPEAHHIETPISDAFTASPPVDPAETYAIASNQAAPEQTLLCPHCGATLLLGETCCVHCRPVADGQVRKAPSNSGSEPEGSADIS
jgi:hypothetical protein